VNIASLLATASISYPDQPAWIYASRQASYRDSATRIARLAAGLRNHFDPRSRVVMVMSNGPEFFEVLWAAFWAGLVAVPVNRHLHAREIGYVARHSGASLVIYDEHTRDAVLDSAAGATTADAGSGGLDALAAPEPAGVAEVDPDSPAWLFYTSGTTGQPKGATLTHRNLLSMTLNYYADIDPVAPGTVYAHAAPLSHGSGLYLLPAVGHGAANVISASQAFDPGDFLSLIGEHDVTHAAFLAPTMLRRLTDAARREGWTSATLRHVMVGGAALYEQDLADAIEVFGPVIGQMYGQGEAPMTIAVMPPHLLTARDTAEGNWRSCGRPFTGVEVRIGDGKASQPGNGGPGDGQIWVRGDVVMSGYWDDAEATAGTLVDGWLATGDIGHVDDRGFVYLTDRAKDVIISGGSNIYPREVEEALVLHPGVHEAVVVGVPDQEWGESVRAYVVAAPGATVTEAELIAHCRDLIASFKKPKSVVFLGDLPKSANGKILKRVLRDRAAG
jgi:acyl-CoA synthetase (AMP-forming)/AMP-acid ligase II